MKTIYLIIIYLFTACVIYASTDDYHPETGEPKCMTCHTPDRKFSIDYTRDDSCGDCHDSFFSKKFTAIDVRYKTDDINDKIYAVNINKNTDDKIQETKNKTKAVNKILKDMVLVPAGEFTMGSNDWWPKSSPEHKKILNTFYIDKYEVTNKQYKEFVDSTGQPFPNHWENAKIPSGKENHPAVQVTWYEAEAYCKWNGKRLPTEAEWEKAARGTDKRVFPWGDKFDRDKANTPQHGKDDTMPVGSFKNGISPYGVHDMAGNVWEWTADWFKPYPGNTHPDENYGENYKVLRGGSFYDCTYYRCGISAPTYNKIFFQPSTKNKHFGFRCAKDE